MLRSSLLALTLLLLAPAALAEDGAFDATEDVDHTAAWTSYLAQQRALRLQELAAYSAAGQFPRKPGEPGWHHQFLDAQGVPCAVANLMIQGGHRALVEETARTRNDVLLRDVERGPLHEWVLTSGLTEEEVQMIQVPGWEAPRLTRDLVQPVEIEPVDAETQRLQSRFVLLGQLLSLDDAAALDKAVGRLGDRVHSPPPARFAAR